MQSDTTLDETSWLNNSTSGPSKPENVGKEIDERDLVDGNFIYSSSVV
mgnify:CR=1 FL=1